MSEALLSVRGERSPQLVHGLASSADGPQDTEDQPRQSARHVLVIGGAGYVGSVLVDVLLMRGYRVRVMDNFLYDHFSVAEGLIARPGASLVVGDLRDPDALLCALEGIRDVVLLASLVGDPISRKYPDLARAVNLRGSTAVLDTLSGRGLRRFVFTSTCSNY